MPDLLDGNLINQEIKDFFDLPTLHTLWLLHKAQSKERLKGIV